MSAFDAEQFLNQEYDSSTDTHVTPVPPGEYQGQVTKVNAREIMTKDGERIVMDITWEILDDEVKKVMEMKKVTARQSVFLDLTDEGAIDMSKGKNRQLGLVREAVGQNATGKPWNPGMLNGQVAQVTITNDPDKDDPENIYTNVKRVVSI